MGRESANSPLYSIGHSNHELAHFCGLIHRFNIRVLADVRSHPLSRYVPQYNKDALPDFLGPLGVQYLFLGRELGGRPANPDYYDDEGYVLYDRVAEDRFFLEALSRLEKGRKDARVAVMCSEENPAVCHRHLLIGRVLTERGVPYVHIRSDGELQTDEEVRRTEGKKVEVYQPSLFGEMEEKPWRSLKPLAAKWQNRSDADAMDE